jgi:hypothetical protein
MATTSESKADVPTILAFRVPSRRGPDEYKISYNTSTSDQGRRVARVNNGVSVNHFSFLLTGASFLLNPMRREGDPSNSDD